MILAAVFGVVIGLTLAGLGAGASILAVPALVYGVGQPLDTAIPTSLAVVAISSVGSIIPRERRRQVQWRVAFVFGAAGIPATFAGTAVGHFLPQRWLLLAFAALMVVVAIRMLRGGGEDTAGACRTADGRVDWRRCLPKALGAGAGVGVLTGLLGVGGGFVIVPTLAALLGLEAQAAVATSLVVVLLNSVAGLGAHVTATPNLDYPILAVFAAAALAAALLGGRLAPRLPAATLRRWFAYVVLVVAAGVAVAAVVDPDVLG